MNCPKKIHVYVLICAAAVILLASWANRSANADQHINEAQNATVSIGEPAKHGRNISPYLTGKFCAHFRNNIYHGMDAQLLRNPTFADYRFPATIFTPDGIRTFINDPDEIARQMRKEAVAYQGWPEKELDSLVESYADGLAGFWTRIGTKQEVAVSPDCDDYGNRAQRVETAIPNRGIAQWTYLPLHRIRHYEFELFARAPESCELSVTLICDGKVCGEAKIAGVGSEWRKYSGTLWVPRRPGLSDDAPYRFAILIAKGGRFVISRAVLRPADHVHGFDVEVLRLLKEQRIPILRGIGGNFISGYHWQDGIGPIEARPTRQNYASGQWVEPNMFGADEFIDYCREIGSEPLIIVNAGNGTPEEAARWVEYCNGPADSPMGRLRAANGHPQPYRVRHWEIGNELYGRWQIHWTTPQGNLDRYRRFAKAMLAADPDIQLYACGSQLISSRDADWNRTLIEGAGPDLGVMTTHLLVGSNIPRDSDPLDVFCNYMFMTDLFAEKWAVLADEMQKAGVAEPRVAITELQISAQLAPAEHPSRTRLHKDNLIRQASIAEALYDALLYHHAVRMTPRLSVITHSATINHGGGLCKEKERVYAQPCYYLQSIFADFAGTVPLEVSVRAPQERAPMVVPSLRVITADCEYAAIDAIAARRQNGDMLVSLVHRGTRGPILVDVDLGTFRPAGKGEMWTLAADKPWEKNTLAEPRRIVPQIGEIDAAGSKISLELQPFSIVQLRVPAGDN